MNSLQTRRLFGRRRYGATRCATAIVAVSLLAVSPAVASRPPTNAERSAILRAAGTNPYPSGWAHRTVRISTVSSRWAAVHIVANRGHQTQVQNDVASMYRTKHHGWVTHQVGNGGGCGVPAAVVHDLGLACV